MTDHRNAPRDPRDEPDATSWSNQTPLQQGSSRQWMIPATVLAVIALAILAFALRLQLALPLIGIVFVAAVWVAMLLVSRRHDDARRRNRILAWLMAALAFGTLAIVTGIYFVEALGAASAV